MLYFELAKHVAAVASYAASEFEAEAAAAVVENLKHYQQWEHL